jgi:glycosyltransferase involved in cell wall biosynthesis
MTASTGSNPQVASLRLLIISADFPPTKVAEADHAYHLAIQFARRGAEVTVLTSAVDQERPTYPGVTVASVMRSWSFLALPRFVAFLRRCQPDAILLVYLGTMYDHHPMITFAPTLARAFVPTAAFVTQIENTSFSDTISWTTKALRKFVRQWVTGAGTDYDYGTLLRDSRKVIVLSDRHRDRLREHCSEIDERSVLIPPAPIVSMCSSADGLARRQGRAALGFADEEVVFAYYGYIYPGKGIETMLKAFATASARCRLRLLVIGGFVQHTFAPTLASRSRSYEASVMELASTLGISTKITWVGHCPSTEMQGSRYLRAADVCVLPFDAGVYLNNSSFAAAAAHALPILTTAGARIESPIVDGVNVLLSPPKDPTAMARAMERLANDQEFRWRLASGAEVLAREWFDWDRVVERISAVFSEA